MSDRPKRVESLIRGGGEVANTSPGKWRSLGNALLSWSADGRRAPNAC
jgi:hypothetical protein